MQVKQKYTHVEILHLVHLSLLNIYGVIYMYKDKIQFLEFLINYRVILVS